MMRRKDALRRLSNCAVELLGRSAENPHFYPVFCGKIKKNRVKRIFFTKKFGSMKKKL
jgi:hypothetical protein